MISTVAIILAGAFGLFIAVRSIRRAIHYLGAKVEHYEPWQ